MMFEVPPETSKAKASRRDARRRLTAEERRDRWNSQFRDSIVLDPHDLSRALDPADQPALDRLDQILGKTPGK